MRRSRSTWNASRSLASSPASSSRRHWHISSRSGFGHGMCQNSAVRTLRPAPAQIQRRHREVIVLQEYRRIGCRHFAIDRRGKPRVHLLVRGPVLGPELRPDVDEMAERPQALRSRIRRSRRRTRPAESTGGAGRRTGCREAPVSCRRSSTVSRSAVPAPCAIHVPPRSRISASSATATPPVAVAHVMRPSLVEVVQIRLAVRDDEQRPRRVRIDFAGAHQARAEERGSDQLVDGDQRHEQHLHLRAPCRKLRRDRRRETQRDARLRDQAGPDVLAARSLTLATSQPDAHADPDQPDARQRRDPSAATPAAASVSSRSDVPDRDEEDDEERQRARSGWRPSARRPARRPRSR